jgi:hypothetical protein
MSASPSVRTPEPRPPAPTGRFDPGPDPAAAAFGLASFLHPERETALRVVIAALSKLEVAVSAQDKRLYYRGRDSGASFKAGAFRRKVWMGEQQLLQRLVAIESEPFERDGEKPGAPPLAPEDGVVRFVKHVFRITSRRNSFYVALGIGRVLHGYNTVETKGMYDALAPESAAEKAEDYFRARKAVLMREIRERFGDALTAIRGAHGEERFETVDSTPYAALVSECLEWFTPWGTSCPAALPLPERPADAAHESEMERMHAMLHPACLGRLVRWLGFDDSASKLQLPRLSFAREGGGSRPRRGGTPPLTPDEKQSIDEEIRAQSARRRRSAAGLLRCDVDGATAGYLDPAADGRLTFDVGEASERIEVFATTKEGEVPLASCLLARDERSDLLRPGRLTLVLEGGQRVTFAIDPSGSTRPGGARVEVSYREPFLRGLARALSGGAGARLIGFVPLRMLAAFGVAAVAAALVLSTRTARPPAADDGGHLGPAATPAAASAPTPASPALAPPKVSAPAPPVERGVEPAPAAVPLGTVRTVWVETEGAPGLDALVRERLAGGILRAADSRDTADALLRLRANGSGAALDVRAELRAADGTTLWTGPAPPYTGTPEEISRKIVSDLARDAAAARSRSSRRGAR